MNPGIDAKNLTAQLHYRAAGNPPSTLPGSAVSNSYPGLDSDFRNVWARLFAGIQLHESCNFVVGVDADAPADVRELANGYVLVRVGDQEITVPVTGPASPGGPDVLLERETGSSRMPLEWSNVLAAILSEFAGRSVECTFESLDAQKTITATLEVRRFFDEIDVAGERVERPAIARELVPPGALTQSLCAPWQFDYRYCGCYYWASARPDYVNVEARADGTSDGNNWLEKDRTPSTPKVYIADEDSPQSRLVTTAELMTSWERLLRFVVGGVDEPPIAPGPERQP